LLLKLLIFFIQIYIGLKILDYLLMWLELLQNYRF